MDNPTKDLVLKIESESSSDEEIILVSSSVANASASQNRPAGLNGQPEMVVNVTEQRLGMNSLNLVNRIYTNLEGQTGLKQLFSHWRRIFKILYWGNGRLFK